MNPPSSSPSTTRSPDTLQRVGQLPVLDQLDAGLEYQRRRGQHVLRDESDGAAQLPHGEQHER